MYPILLTLGLALTASAGPMSRRAAFDLKNGQDAIALKFVAESFVLYSMPLNFHTIATSSRPSPLRRLARKVKMLAFRYWNTFMTRVLMLTPTTGQVRAMCRRQVCYPRLRRRHRVSLVARVSTVSLTTVLVVPLFLWSIRQELPLLVQPPQILQLGLPLYDELPCFFLIPTR